MYFVLNSFLVAVVLPVHTSPTEIPSLSDCSASGGVQNPQLSFGVEISCFSSLCCQIKSVSVKFVVFLGSNFLFFLLSLQTPEVSHYLELKYFLDSVHNLWHWICFRKGSPQGQYGQEEQFLHPKTETIYISDCCIMAHLKKCDPILMAIILCYSDI